jgi:hypothetical protein
VLIALASGAGCASYQTSGSPRAALPLPPDVQQYYRYLSLDPIVTVRTTERHTDYSVKEVSIFPPSGSEAIQVIWFDPKEPGNHPLVLISPIRGSDTIVVDDCARVFASSGYHAAIVKRAHFKFDPDGPLTQVEDTLHAAVIRHRQALDWLLEQPGVDTNRVASFGISYGAIVDAALAAVEPRIKVHVIDLAGGPLAGVMRSSYELGLRRDWDCIRRGHDLTNKQVYQELQNVIRTDPVKLAQYVPRDDVLMLIARFDHSVPTRYQMQLWRALGKPRADFVLLGHYTSILALPAHRLSIMNFFEEKFAALAEHPPEKVIEAKK